MSSIYNKANLIGGSYQDVSGNPLSYGYLRLQLSQNSTVTLLGSSTGQAILSGVKIKLFLDGSGNLVPNQFIWTNDVLTPSGSFYTVKAYNSSGLEVWANPQQWVLRYMPTINVGTITPN